MTRFKKHFFIIGLLALISLLISGCGNRGSAPQRYQYHHYFPQSYFGGGIENSDTVALDTYDHSGRGGYNHSIFNDLDQWRSLRELNPEKMDRLLSTHNALAKRKSALFLGRGVIDYCLVNYDYNGKIYESGGFFTERYSYRPVMKPLFLICMKFDAVSNVLYNVSYIFSIPAKLIHGTKVSNGIGDYTGIVLQLAIGGTLASIMIPAGFTIGFICHPFESLANMFVGFSVSSYSLTELLSLDFIKNTSNYSYNVNLVSSAVDLFWGAMITPLLDIIRLFS